ncbi:MAG: thioredoxin [Gemmataceae bacterium]|nr:thioredoxin [Gemmataceae bacterium]
MGFVAAYEHQEPTRAEIDAIAGPLLVEFGAPWCGYCQELQPALTELLSRFPEVRHIKIHDAQGRPLGRSFRVKLWPNLVFLRDGEVLLQLARPSESDILDGLRAFTTR